jgi:nitrate/TMAO reductase-like tetraheme cytochrome c subunit
MKHRSVYTAVFSVALGSMGVACATERKAEDEHPRLVLAGDTGVRSTIEPGALATVRAESVTWWKGPGGRPFEVTVRTTSPATALTRKFGTITLRTSLRSRAADLGQYPCTSCHLGRAMVLADARVRDAHQNITAVHPVQTGGLCSTCHAADNVELLALKSGERASLDHTYRLCAQCHSQQATAWAGGAHGKRLDGWQGRRVLMGCADCHDPHKPAIEHRIPFRAPQIERTRGVTR